MSEEKSDHEIIRHQQRDRADRPAGHRVVIADDRVLHGVRKRQQHDEIEWIELRQLAFPEHAQQHDQHDVDDDGPDDFFGDGEGDGEHVLRD